MTVHEAYARGFCKAAEACGVDPAVLCKMAYFGPAPVFGSPVLPPPPPLTVGQVMYNVSAPGSPMSGVQQREFKDQVVHTGLNVNSPARSLLRAGVGAVAGNLISNALGMGPFMRGVMTAAGAGYGYNH